MPVSGIKMKHLDQMTTMPEMDEYVSIIGIGRQIGKTRTITRMMEETMGNVTAYLNITLETACPKCNHDFDITDHEDNDILEKAMKTATCNSIEVRCPECKHKFLVDTDY